MPLENSVGVVVAATASVSTRPLALEKRREPCPVSNSLCETYGTLNATRSNAVLVCHALSGGHHVAGVYADDREGTSAGGTTWSGRASRSIRAALLRRRASTTSAAATVRPGRSRSILQTGKRYGARFSDGHRRGLGGGAGARLADRLGIDTWAAVIGGSLGGMQALEWTLQFPDRIRHAIVIASAPKLSAQNIAFNEVARQAILSDPGFSRRSLRRASASFRPTACAWRAWSGTSPISPIARWARSSAVS